MKEQDKIDQLEARLFEARRNRETDYQISDRWQQELMLDIHRVVYEEEQLDSFVPAFMKRFAVGAVVTALIFLMTFLIAYNTVFQSDREQVINEFASWTMTDNSELDF